MDVVQVCDRIADAVGDPVIPGLNALGYSPDSVPEPCFYTAEFDVSFDQAMRRGLDEIQLTCRLLVSRASDRAGQAMLKRYLAGSGPYSIKQALEAARGAPGEPALAGAADDLHVQRVQGMRLYQVGEYQYYGAEFIIRIIGNGTTP